MSASPGLSVLVDADNVFPARAQPVLDVLAERSLGKYVFAAGSPQALARLEWPEGSEVVMAAGWQQADLVLARAYVPSTGPLLLITGDGDFGLLAARHPGAVLVVSGAPSTRLRTVAQVLDPAVEGTQPLIRWLDQAPAF